MEQCYRSAYNSLFSLTIQRTTTTETNSCAHVETWQAKGQDTTIKKILVDKFRKKKIALKRHKLPSERQPLLAGTG